MTKLPDRPEETLGGFIVHGIPFPAGRDPESLAVLKHLTPIQIEQEYRITYLHSYAQDSPWFAGLTNRTLLGVRDPKSGYTYATPRGHDMQSGEETEWIDLTERPAKIHAFTVCHFGSEEFLPETPFALVLVEFEGVHTLLLSRLLGVDLDRASLDWIGMPVRPRFKRNSKLKPTDVYFVPVRG
jgi:uncharacterized OB-fold protein